MKKLCLIVCFIIFFSCSKNKNEEIYGNWYFERELDSKKNQKKSLLRHLDIEGFNICNDSIIDFKKPFFYTIETKTRFGEIENTQYNYSSYYLGSKTKYIYTGNKLIYFNKSINKNDTIILKKVKDNLIIKLSNEDKKYEFVKRTSNYSNSTFYDAIIIDRGPCFGDCPINSTYINRNGEYFFKATGHNTVFDGNYTAEIEKNRIKQIFNIFDKIEFKKLKDVYTYSATDSQTNYITFIKNGKIVKTISSYIECPIDLKKALTELSYLYQQVNINYNQNFIFNEKLMNCSFDDSIKLKDSEIFFLEILLSKAKDVKLNFNQKYKLDFFSWGDEKIKSIYTDGRYYQITYKNNTSVIKDIGFNFVIANPILKTMRLE